MGPPCIITVAITGSLPGKKDNPAVPISPEEQIDSTQEAFEAGASIVHLHVRNDDGSPTSDPERFARVLEGIRRHCPGIITQVSTGGRSGSGRERGSMLALKPDMASLATGSVNFPNRVYENPPERLAPEATWTGAGIGKDQLTVSRWSLELGGHCRTGLEDNIRMDRHTLASSNAALVRQTVELCAEYGRPVASAQEARRLLSL